MQLPKVSLLMPAYNSIKYIEEAINSVKQQIYKNWELIIIDDCSTDDTWKILNKIAKNEPRIKVYRNLVTLGIPKNRAKAYMYATGDFIGHFDHDDILEPHALTEMVIAFAKNPEVILIWSDRTTIDENGTFKQYEITKDFDPHNPHVTNWRHLTLVYKWAIDKVGGYNRRINNPCEDSDLYAKIATKYLCMRLPKILYNHRWHGNNSIKLLTGCEKCTTRAECDAVKMWAKFNNYDPITFTPLTKAQNG